MRLRPLWLLVFISFGCGKSQPELPGYEIIIPDDVPESLELTEKDGTKREGNGRQMYAAYHRAGWKFFWEKHDSWGIDPGDERAVENYIPQCFGIEARGYSDGFMQCQQYIIQKK